MIRRSSTISYEPESAGHNHPCGDLLNDGRRRDYMDICVPMYQASINGNWEAARDILRGREYLVRYSITQNKETALHIATMARSTEFVEHLVEMMGNEDLELENQEGNNALGLAAIAGNISIAEILVHKNRQLLTNTSSSYKTTPLYLAALHGNHDMVIYLYNEAKVRPDYDWSDDVWQSVFLKCIEVNFFDVALQIWGDYEEKVVSQDASVRNVLLALAKKPEVFVDIQVHPFGRIFNSVFAVDGIKENDATKLLRKIWKKTMEKPNNVIEDIIQGCQFVAVRSGNAKFLVELIRQCPDLIWTGNNYGQTIFHEAVLHRHESIYNLLHEMGTMKDMITRLIDDDGNNMLHLAGKIPSKDRLGDKSLSGAAFEVQSELLWFREVQAMVPASYRKLKNHRGLTPSELFSIEHKQLVAEGEAWIKGTISQSMVAAALIATIGFSVAFAIPGGYDQNNGYPIFLHNKAFKLFVILNAISFILSSTSILMFLSIFTSSFDENDFLQSLPSKLLSGQATLFLSIFTAMIAFSTSFFVIYHKNLPIIISTLATIPVIFFSFQQYPLFKSAIRSTYASRFRFKPKTRILYYQNPRL